MLTEEEKGKLTHHLDQRFIKLRNMKVKVMFVFIIALKTEFCEEIKVETWEIVETM